jgi:hypothetical protein
MLTISETTFNNAKMLYPDEWILFGNPEIKNTSVVKGVLLYHSKDKKKVYHVGKNLAEGYQSVTIVYTGNLRQTHHIGILKRV